MVDASPAPTQPPPELSIVGRTYRLTTDDEDWSWFASLPFERIPGKTDQIFVYRAHDAKRSEIVLHTPATLHRGDEHLIARKTYPWSYSSILRPDELRMPDPTLFDPSYVERVVGYDRMTEGDSLRLFNYLARTRQMPHEFWPVQVLWLRDEMNHCNGFTAAYHQLFGYDQAREQRLEDEPSDFEQFDVLLKDPFASLVALAYDEASTIAGYRYDMRIYREIGPSMVAFVGRVTADEGWHFSKFVDLAVRYFSPRLSEVDDILSCAMNLDGRAYKRTFFLDHDPRVEAQFTEGLKRRAADFVRLGIAKRLAKAHLAVPAGGAASRASGKAPSP